jgi:hypothetical protein
LTFGVLAFSCSEESASVPDAATAELPNITDPGLPADPGVTPDPGVPPDTSQPAEGALALCQTQTPIPAWLALNDGIVTATCDAVILHIRPMNSHVLRLRYVGAQPDPAPDGSYAVVETPNPQVTTLTVGTPNGARISMTAPPAGILREPARQAMPTAGARVFGAKLASTSTSTDLANAMAR